MVCAPLSAVHRQNSGGAETTRVAIVTGGAQGIGAAIVEALKKEGNTVHVIDLHFETPAENQHECDVTDADAVEQTIAAIQRQSGSIDILVNNAGIVRDGMIWKLEESDFDLVMDVNLKGPWLVSRAVAPLMRSQGSGRIVNISSRSYLGNAGQSNYSASKGGLVSLTRVLALELARKGITVNAVAPGLIDTPLTRALPDGVFEKLVEAQPGKKAGTVEDVAHAVMFLCSPESSFISGQVIMVDGGKSIGAWGTL